MDLLFYLLIFLLVLIVSSTTNKLLPFLPMPLIQILLGIGLGLCLPNNQYHLDTELFLALVIGPLLFREAQEADVTSILKHWRIVLYLIFPRHLYIYSKYGRTCPCPLGELTISCLPSRRGCTWSY